MGRLQKWKEDYIEETLMKLAYYLKHFLIFLRVLHMREKPVKLV